MSKKSFKILIAEDSDLLTETLKQFVKKNYPNASIHTTNDGKSALRKLKHTTFDLLILDLMMPPNDKGGYLVTEKIHKEKVSNPPKVVVYTNHYRSDEITPVINHGINVIVAKSLFDAELAQAMQAALLGENFFTPDVKNELDRLGRINRQVQPKISIPDLSVRQEQVLKHTCHDGLTNADISNRMKVSIKMVEKHKANICECFSDHFNENIVRMQQVSAKLIKIGYRFKD